MKKEEDKERERGAGYLACGTKNKGNLLYHAPREVMESTFN